MIEYYFRIGDYNFWIGGFETKERSSVTGFHKRIIGSIWELLQDLRAEKPEEFEHECVMLDWRSLKRLWPENDIVVCPYCEEELFREMPMEWEELDEVAEKTKLATHGTAECPNGIHTCILSLPVYTCEDTHSFVWLGRFVDLDKKRAVRQLLRKYEWDV